MAKLTKEQIEEFKQEEKESVDSSGYMYLAEEVAEAETKTEDQLREEEEMQRLEEGLASAAEMRESVTSFIEKDPAYTAGVMRKWMREKSTT